MSSRESNATGRLYVFEGPDEVGKTTIVHKTESRLLDNGISCSTFAFPGNVDGTLGKLVYRLHHQPESLGLELDHPLALQLLHIAAHVEAVDSQIKPALRENQVVLLDRYWWSTYVYGKTSGIPDRILSKAISVERDVWDPVVPDCVFCIVDGPHSSTRDSNHHELVRCYKHLADNEASSYPTRLLHNTPPPESTVNDVLDHIADDLNLNSR